MKNLQKFSENQLSKKQMNEVRGGNCYSCSVKFPDGNTLNGTGCGAEGASPIDVAKSLSDLYKDMANSVAC